MIRLFQHHFRRQTLTQLLFDLGLPLLGVVAWAILHSTSGAGEVGAVTAQGLKLAAGLLVINTASGLYQPVQGRSLGHSCARAALALLFSLPLTYLVFSLLPESLAYRDSVRWAAMVCVAAVIGHRVHSAHVERPGKFRTKVLIYGSGSAAVAVAETLRTADPQAQIVGFFPSPNESHSVVSADKLLLNRKSLRDCAQEMRVDEIIVALADRRGGNMPLRDLLDCKVGGVRVSDLSTHFERIMGQIRLDHLHPSWLIFGDGFAQGAYRALAKRTFDIVCASTLLIIASPVMLITALAIKLESRGPTLYRQERVGQAGRTFEVLKFRSMCQGAEKNGQPQWAAANDARVTRVGAIIRRFRIDELPQLVNVLRGEMSLVGPRPERPFFVEQLTQGIPYYAVRHSVKPGVTGWAQVRYHYGATFEDSLQKLQYDLYYVKNNSLFLDFVILLETIGVVLTGKGAR